MILPKTGVSRPVFTLMFFLALLLFGFISYLMLPKDVFPEIEMPALTVATVYPGASAEEVEEQVTVELEEVLAGTGDLRNMTSESRENVSFITLQFDWGTDLEEAVGAVRDFINFKEGELPEETEAPVVMRVDTDMFPVLIYGVNAAESYEDLGRIIDDNVINALNRAPGVGALLVMGEPTREVKIEIDPYKQKAYNLSINNIVQSLQAENITIPAGNIIAGESELSVTVPGDFQSLQNISNTLITVFDGKPVRLSNIASITLGLEDPNEIARVNARDGVSIFVMKQAGANTLEVVEGVREEMEDIKPILPDDVQIVELMDNSELVVFSIRNLFRAIFFAGIFVILVVFFFLREIKSSLVIILTIPFSLIVAFIYMYAAGFTVNIFSLLSLAIAIGMVIDNAIVVLENITRHIENGIPPKQAAIIGTREMSLAITAATITTIAIFLPLVFMSGIVGIIFRQLAVLTAITMLASLFTALFLTPMLCSKFLANFQKSRKKSAFYKISDQFFDSLEKFYSKILTFSVYHKTLVISIVALIFIISLVLTRFIGTDYIPEFDAGDVSARIETRIDASTDETLKITKKIEEIFKEEIPELRNVFSLTGQSEEGLLGTVGFREGKNVSTIFGRMVLPEERERTSEEVAEIIHQRIAEIPEVEVYSTTGGSLISAAIMGNIQPIEVKITGHDLEVINRLGTDIENRLANIEQLANVESTVDRGKPELRINIDKDKATAVGLSTAHASMQIRQSLYGADGGSINLEGERIPLNVRYPQEYRRGTAHLENIMLSTLTGDQVPLSLISDMEEGIGRLEIKREMRQRAVYVTVDNYGVSLGEAANIVEKELDKITLPDGVNLEIGGQVAEQEEAFEDMYLIFAIGLVLVFMVMASLFESFKNPFLIIFTIPLSIIGVILAFLVTGLTLSVVTFLGLIMLIGIVVNNGIVLVNYTDLLIAREVPFMEAVIQAARNRLRPVLMTSSTTILAMIPMALSTGMGSEIWSPLGITIIGGLIISTMVTLLLIPVLYVVFNKKKEDS